MIRDNVSSELFPKVEQTMDIIKEYGQICWLDISKMYQTFTRLNNKFIKVKSYAEFLKYLNDNYKEILKKDYINYKDIDKKYRCNSVLEGFHAILNEKSEFDQRLCYLLKKN